ncbi:hypothetical protein TSUD_274820 [Trifolium subterraneum]|jgi:hypothetical protein|uniref:Uncharacterized protein n=1 Tax=Trifolium subterraneum TaxID=3900 RepID=A0A2Z6NFY9_TRISU|nr:hypothetical protein TSUD_274820 [Trifolium subterraneum]
MLDNIIIGRDKIAANLSRFNRSDGNTRRSIQHMKNKPCFDSISGQNQNNHERSAEENTYAQAVRLGGTSRQGGGQRRVTVSYEAEKDDMSRLKKAFTGVVVNLDMTYNIQNAFHAHGYFGVKVTPLGLNLTLLEGQEEVEVQALVDDAKEWMDQWFSEIRP